MKVMVIIRATESSEAGVLPSDELLAAMGKYNEELVAAGVMQAGEGLKPSSEGVRVRFSGADRTVTDGPFAETKELIAGYWLWEVDSLDNAVEWVRRCPNPMPEDSEIEVRPLYEMADFAESDPTGEHTAAEELLRDAIAARNATVQPYLFFSGRCAEALAFYESALGARVRMKMLFSDSPDPQTKSMIEPGFESKIMHSEFSVGSLTLMASDGRGGVEPFKGFRLALTVTNNEDCDRFFNNLEEGGVIDMPLQETFWSPRYGMVTDKLGLAWMVMVAGQPT